LFKTSLRDETRRLVKERPRSLSLRTIAADTGLNIRWLEQFRDGGSPNPGVCFVQTLYEYLTQRQLIGANNNHVVSQHTARATEVETMGNVESGRDNRW